MTKVTKYCIIYSSQNSNKDIILYIHNTYVNSALLKIIVKLLMVLNIYKSIKRRKTKAPASLDQ